MNRRRAKPKRPTGNRPKRTVQPRANISIKVATEKDAPALAALQNAVSNRLTRLHGRGHWSGITTEQSVLREIAASRVLVARNSRRRIIGTLRLATKKPWAIDRAFFVKVPRPLYLIDMAVEPRIQRRGIGRQLMEEAAVVARAWPAQSICLDAYDTGPLGRGAGAGGFYANCGYREVDRVSYRGTPLIYFELLL